MSLSMAQMVPFIAMVTERQYTTIVVGAGPAGIMAALQASERGSVLLVDAMSLPRTKPCGGMLNSYAVDFIRSKLNAEIPAGVYSSPRHIAFRFFDFDRDMRRATSLVFDNTNRQAFDEWLMSFIANDVEVRDNTRLVYCSQMPTCVTVQLRAADDVGAEVETISCDYLIGADGPRGTTRGCLPVSQLDHYKTIQDLHLLKGDLEPYFDCLYARGIGNGYGYGYLIPKGDHAILGSVFYPGTKKAKALHEKALGLYSSYFPIANDSIKREAWSAAYVRSEGDIAEGFGRILLAGEAAGLFSPSSGEGISFALNSGYAAGKAVAEADEGSTLLGKRSHLSCGESDALRIYRELIEPIRAVIARRLRILPVIDSSWGKFLAGFAPKVLVDRMAHRI